jgi:3-amino-5-hydroxybenzoate synthase
VLTAQLAVAGGRPIRTRPFAPGFGADDEVVKAITEAAASGAWWSGAGHRVHDFEERFARAHGASHAVAVTNGTHALELALRTLEIGPGDEVIVPAFTFISTALAVLNVGAVPVPADVSLDTLCVEPEQAESLVGDRTRAIIVVHLAGHMAPVERFSLANATRGLALIEDAAQAHGACRAGSRAGSAGRFGAFSFQDGKAMRAGEGGMVLFADEADRDRAALLANCGRRPGDTTYDHLEAGSNYRMTEFQAAALLVQLDRLDRANAHRESSAAQLDALVAQIPGVTPQGRDPEVECHTRYMYVFRIAPDEFAGASRDAVVEALRAEGIPAVRAYPPVHRTPLFTRLALGPLHRPVSPRLRAIAEGELPCPNSELVARDGIWLPHHILDGSRRDVDDVAHAIRKVQANAGSLR